MARFFSIPPVVVIQSTIRSSVFSFISPARTLRAGYIGNFHVSFIYFIDKSLAIPCYTCIHIYIYTCVYATNGIQQLHTHTHTTSLSRLKTQRVVVGPTHCARRRNRESETIAEGGNHREGEGFRIRASFMCISRRGIAFTTAFSPCSS